MLLWKVLHLLPNVLGYLCVFKDGARICKHGLQMVRYSDIALHNSKVRFASGSIQDFFFSKGHVIFKGMQTNDRNYPEISGSWTLQRKVHTLHIWFTTPNKLKCISPLQMRKFLILFITLSTCIFKPAICWCVPLLLQTWLFPPRKGGMFSFTPRQNVFNLEPFIGHDTVTIIKFLW